MSKRFTLLEAERFLPEVEALMRDAVALKAEYETADNAISELSHRVTMMGGMVIDRDRVIENRERRDRSANELRETVERLQDIGCLIKDLDMGLVDFPTLLRGEEVYLCWKLGETGISFWHGVQEGFGGRKKIDAEFLDNHQGDLPN